MRNYTAYEAIYSYDKLHKPDPPLMKENMARTSYLEKSYLILEGTLLNPNGDDLPNPSGKSIRFPGYSSIFGKPDYPVLPANPVLPDPSGDVWKDANAEFELIKTLNAPGNSRARKNFENMQKVLYGRLSERDKDMLKLADFAANESLSQWFNPGIATAMGILHDYWPRWFGGRADTYARYNKDIYWIPWSFFMDDDYINGVKNDLEANLLNEKARDSLYRTSKS